ncbi:expressed protein [Arabidopsis lyrata subsp. lyrata]|uniref:Expressed protein n=1 Tax=Arabidopsis lyrata subsp. lyrata TaxID=81972 RepID=D7L841_ARALL|nr:expressed protein [Arabidopsis lyrata subsp. lyrata]
MFTNAGKSLKSTSHHQRRSISEQAREDLTATNQTEQHTQREQDHQGESSLRHNHRPQAIRGMRKTTEKMESLL